MLPTPLNTYSTRAMSAPVMVGTSVSVAPVRGVPCTARAVRSGAMVSTVWKVNDAGPPGMALPAVSVTPPSVAVNVALAARKSTGDSTTTVAPAVNAVCAGTI